MKYIHTSLSKIGQQRLDNEDYFGIFNVEDGLLLIVCDGLGGNKAGEVASQLTVKTVNNIFRELKDVDYLARIKQSITEANKIVLEKSSNDADLKGMSTTIEVLYLKDDTAFWGHVGDSRIYIFKNGKLKQLTKDHSLVQKLVDEGFLTLKEAENHPNKNIIMRALGDSQAIDVDLSKQKLNSKDEIKFFICTDGVTNVLNDLELQEILKNKDLHFISNKLSEQVEEKGAPDNYTFILLAKTE